MALYGTVPPFLDPEFPIDNSASDSGRMCLCFQEVRADLACSRMFKARGPRGPRGPRGRAARPV